MQQVAREPKKHCRVTATRVLQKWSAVKAIAARLQKKCGVYDEQTIGHRATTNLLLAGVLPNIMDKPFPMPERNSAAVVTKDNG